MPTVCYNLAMEILHRVLTAGGRAPLFNQKKLAEYGALYLKTLKETGVNPKTAIRLLQPKLCSAKKVVGLRNSEIIRIPGGKFNGSTLLFLEKILNIRSVLTGLPTEVQLELFDEPDRLGSPKGSSEPVADAQLSNPQGESLSTDELQIW